MAGALQFCNRRIARTFGFDLSLQYDEKAHSAVFDSGSSQAERN
jgi:hypothetical protein